MMLIRPDGTALEVDRDPEDVLRDEGVDSTVVDLNVHDGFVEFVVWMGVDATQPINSVARDTIVALSGVHFMCFGPVLLVGADKDVKEWLAHE